MGNLVEQLCKIWMTVQIPMCCPILIWKTKNSEGYHIPLAVAYYQTIVMITIVAIVQVYKLILCFLFSKEETVWISCICIVFALLLLITTVELKTLCCILVYWGWI